jgi:integrase
MANRTVALVRHCKTDAGWRRYPVVMGGNGRVKPGFVMIAGKPVSNDTGHYEIRYYDGPKLKYENVGTNAADALGACVRKTKLLTAKGTAAEAGVKIVEEKGRTSLASALKAFVSAAEGRGSLVASKAYARVTSEFLEAVGKSYADEVAAEDFAKFQATLRKRRQSDRTIANKHRLVLSFVRFAGVTTDAIPKSAPKFESSLPEIYDGDQLKAFFGSLTQDYHRVVFTLLLKTGLREQEAMFLQWPDIDFKRRTLLVRSKPHLGFKIKDKAERSIPLPDDLVEMLKTYKTPSRTFVIGTANDKPNTKLLRTLKRLAHGAGLNCEMCTSCIERNECEVWYLHRFRSTFVTTMLRSGLDLRSVMELSGHSDMESVMRYLRPAEGAELRAKVNSVSWGD